MNRSSARTLLAMACLIGAVGWLSVFELRSPFDRRLERLKGQQPKEVVNVQLANPLNYLPRRLSADSIASEREEMARFAKATSQPILAGDGPDELRILVSTALAETPTGVSLTGYIIRDRTIAKCEVAYGVSLEAPMTGHCNKAKSLSPGDALYDWSVLERLGGAEYFCEVNDGWWVTFEGRRNGRWFMLSSSNPDHCQDKGSKVIIRLLRGI